LMTVFIPSQDGFPGFIDEWGNSVIEDPPEPVRKLGGGFINEGAKTFLLNRRRKLELEGNEEGLITEMRDYPMEFKESFMGAAKSSTFPILRMSRRIADLALQPQLYKRVFYEWTGAFGSSVREVEVNSSNELEVHESKKLVWTRTYQWPTEQRNMRQKGYHHTGHDTWTPSWQVRRKCVMGVDMALYSKNEVSGKKKSYHAAQIFYKHDEQIDPTEEGAKDRKDWVSGKFICWAKTRDMTKDQFAEECLKASIFYGCMVYPERNINTIYDCYQKWGYMGYLLYDVDENGDPVKMPGYTVSDGSVNTTRQDVWHTTEDYLKDNCDYEDHYEYLTECKDIQGVDEMTHYDFFAAGCAALRGALSQHTKFQQFMEDVESSHTFANQYFEEYYSE